MSSTNLRRALVGLLLCSLFTAGCSLNRAFEVKNQFCDFDAHFSWSVGDQLEFVFSQPVIRDSDVQFLIGYPPTEVLVGAEGETHRYVVEKVSDHALDRQRFTFELGYQIRNGRKRLQWVKLPPEAGSLEQAAMWDDPAMMAMAAQDICSAKLGFSSLLSREDDIDPAHLENLPSRAQIIALLGEPSQAPAQDGAMIYEYRVLGSLPGEPALRMMLWYDTAGLKPRRVETRYREMLSQADLERGKVRFRYGA